VIPSIWRSLLLMAALCQREATHGKTDPLIPPMISLLAAAAR